MSVHVMTPDSGGSTLCVLYGVFSTLRAGEWLEDACLQGKLMDTLSAVREEAREVPVRAREDLWVLTRGMAVGTHFLKCFHLFTFNLLGHGQT